MVSRRAFYASEYARDEGMRAGFEVFKAFEQDAKDFEGFARTKLGMPVLVLTGEKASGQVLIDQAKLVGTDVRGIIVPGAGHWLLEEATGPAPRLRGRAAAAGRAAALRQLGRHVVAALPPWARLRSGMADGGLRALARAAGQGDLEAARSLAHAAERAGLGVEADAAWARLARRGDREALERLGGLRRPLRTAPGQVTPLPDLPPAPPGDVVVAEGEDGRVHLRRLASPRDIAREATFLPPADGRRWSYLAREDQPGRLAVTWGLPTQSALVTASALVDVTPEAFGRLVVRLPPSLELLPRLTPELLLAGDDTSLVALALHDGSIRWRSDGRGVRRVVTDLADVLLVHARELSEASLADGGPNGRRYDRGPMATLVGDELPLVEPAWFLLLGPVLVAARGHGRRRSGASWLVAVRRESNALLWQRSGSGLDVAAVAAATDTLYTAWLARPSAQPVRAAGHVEAIDARSGDTLWRRDLGPCEAIGLTPVEGALEVSVDGRRARYEA